MMDNTALASYWSQGFDESNGIPKKPLCSLCYPEIGKWHGEFERIPLPADSELGPDGFVHNKDDEYLARLKREEKERQLTERQAEGKDL